ncbi:hypothetical protein DUNSADRAFT_8944 [Dunaliella salina]|uniref:Uncharacterized protein n=1 Tax=Dunaliella salina TaxID=3046 RepID=A0ABQ7FSS3_DUNSA|nr:hypothetical protein DUNSADRAFT_8944 [Dunaliella salina]|eukprot:KAF5825534.1 hypothetical protein DUNSADRAFT_8944 [Dunaliella salina]
MWGCRARRVEDMGPLALAYQQATKKVGASFNQAIAEALCDSDPSCELRITGAVLNAVASTALAEVLSTCHHLTSLQLTRTVLNHADLEILLPAC